MGKAKDSQKTPLTPHYHEENKKVPLVEGDLEGAFGKRGEFVPSPS